MAWLRWMCQLSNIQCVVVYWWWSSTSDWMRSTACPVVNTCCTWSNNTPCKWLWHHLPQPMGLEAMYYVPSHNPKSMTRPWLSMTVTQPRKHSARNAQGVKWSHSPCVGTIATVSHIPCMTLTSSTSTPLGLEAMHQMSPLKSMTSSLLWR